MKAKVLQKEMFQLSLKNLNVAESNEVAKRSNRTSFGATCFGGYLLVGKRKSQRPLSFQECTHFILRLKEDWPGLLEPQDVKLQRYLRD